MLTQAIVSISALNNVIVIRTNFSLFSLASLNIPLYTCYAFRGS
jgi:hypothetical protein